MGDTAKTHDEHEAPGSPEIHFEPLVNLPKVEVKSLEEEEETILQLRAKMYRYVVNGDEKEWKERGTGDLKILRHKQTKAHRVLMRRDKTLKICANHYVTKDMELKPNCGSDKAFVYTAAADYVDDEAKPETLAVKFGNADNAKKFKDEFEKIQKGFDSEGDNPADAESEKLAKELEGLKVKEGKEPEQVQNKQSDENKNSDKSEETKADSKPESEEKKSEGSAEDVPEK